MNCDPTIVWEDVREGDTLPAISMATTYRQAVMHVGAGRDYMVDHYDREQVQANGHPTVYFNTLFHQSMVDRTIIGWAGPRCFLVRRKISMRGPIYAGDEVRGIGRVTRVYRDEGGRGRVDLSVTLSTPAGVRCESEASIALPMRLRSPVIAPLASTEALPSFLSSRQRAFANSPAIIAGGRTITFNDLQRRSIELADALGACGFCRGDRLGILVSSGTFILEALFAAARLGVIVVPLNIRLTSSDIQFIVGDSQPRLLLVAKHLEALAVGAVSAVRLVTVDEDSIATLTDVLEPRLPNSMRLHEPLGASDDPLLILYTSGTTGSSKGCVLTHRNIIASTVSMREYRNPGPGELLLLALPLFHVAGLGLAFSQLAAGGCVLFPTRGIGIEALLKLLSHSGATEAALPPPHLPALMDLQEREQQTLSLRRMVVGGGMYDREFLDRLTRTMGTNGTLEFFAGYGQTEAGNFIACMNRNEQLDHPRACGKALAHVELAIFDSHGAPLQAGEAGELCVRGPSVMREYWHQPQATALAITDGWLHTGDVMSIDSQGFLSFVARIKELIKTGGENVYPAEVESILRQHPCIADCGVAGIPDLQWGEVVKAFIVVAPGCELDSEELTSWCKSKMAGYKRPRQFAFVEHIPRDPIASKIQRQLLIRPPT